MKLDPKEITGAVALTMREERGMTQKEFWGPVGVQQSVASRYERGGNIPRAIRLMIASVYQGTNPVTVPHASAVKKAKAALETAAKSLSEAHAALASI